MKNTTNTTPNTVTLGDRTFDAEWLHVDDLVVGRSLVVEGPSAGWDWRDADSVSVVTRVEAVGDRTNTEVETSNGQVAAGNWSRMTFLVVDAAVLG
jgi:hypothetical protein